ncbi:CheY-P-specific phosphatase CheX [Malaciobacter pacificus]|uniref:Two-component system response regulator n=1 Tax=Malaciobacter pacificus TaxID=1080223 RepID=A0A5C2H7F7_9BACT|nr:two-component system response regulator [Malaciobacter pacificus]GGD45732.1 CheY-P-specific phosphatase CheX [Malaciobacter pacificus]
MVFLKQNILIIEDELETLELMVEIFESKFSKVFTAVDGYDAIEVFKNNKIDVVLCDVNIPKLNGLETIIKIREVDYSVPIIIITAYSDTETLLKASNCNVQGYILKPMKFEDIQYILKKVYQHQNNEYHNGRISINSSIILDTVNSEFMFEGNSVKLTLKELEFLKLLIKKRGSAVHYSIIERVVWNDNVMSSTSLRTLVKNIRKKISYDIVENVPKVGYKVNI